MSAKTLVYQLYLFGFLEKGDPTRFYQKSALKAATEHLRCVKDLGADTVWLGPIFKSPWHDHGYDIADYYEIESRFGDLAEFDEFVSEAHRLGLRIIIDLVLNHTSTAHEWFTTHPEYYCWSKQDRLGWRNLFDGESAWRFDERRGEYYLHLFHETQADLNWFPKGPDKDLNWALVQQFQHIIDFWTIDHVVDGFRLDVPQAINKDFSLEQLEFGDMLYGDQSIKVLNALFGNSDCFLMLECFDPTFGELTDYYIENTPVNFVLNVLLKDQITEGEETFLELIKTQTKSKGFMLDLESHDSPRFPSRGVAEADAIWYLFNSGANAICLYQGQELALANPTEDELPDYRLLDLDAESNMRFRRGELLSDLRPTSRANARVRLPLDEYEFQESFPSSYLNLTKQWINRWLES